MLVLEYDDQIWFAYSNLALKLLCFVVFVFGHFYLLAMAFEL